MAQYRHHNARKVSSLLITNSAVNKALSWIKSTIYKNCPCQAIIDQHHL
jgi:hypothetical protein